MWFLQKTVAIEPVYTYYFMRMQIGRNKRVLNALYQHKLLKGGWL